jgi:twinkle protein
MKAPTFADIGIEIPPGRAGEIDVLCPECSPTRKKSRDKCLSVNTVDGIWCCHHCGWSGALSKNGTGYGVPLRQRLPRPLPQRVYTIPKPPPSHFRPKIIVSYFAARGIPESILITAGITADYEFSPIVRKKVLAIRFPYLHDGKLVNIKYRSLDKQFWMVKGAQRILYGLDDIASAETMCLVEGEIDKLSIATAGGPPTVSVPDGAPAPDARHYGTKFSFLDETAMAHLHGATIVLIGSDMDAPGQKLAQELATRIGPTRCRRVSWLPYKDGNEMLVAEGPQAVLNALAAAEPFRVPPDADIPHGTRPVRLLPPTRGRRPVVELPPVEACHAR